MEKFDFLGQPINLYHKNSDTLKTSFGGVMTILSFIIMGLVIFAFGQDFFNRTNPKVIFSTETLDEYELHQINNRNFSIAFRIENAFGNIYNDDRNIFVIGKYNFFNKINGVWVNEANKLLLPRRCTLLDFDKNSKFKKEYNIKDYLCLDIKDKTGGYWNGNFIGVYSIIVMKCIEGKTNFKNENCYRDNERPVTFDNLYFNMHYQIINVNPNEYEENHAIKAETMSDYFRLDPILKKSKYNFFEITELISDYGWILNSIKKTRIMGYKYGYSDFLISDLTDEYTGAIGAVFFYNTKSLVKINREYPKIQDLAAQVGGIMKFFVTIFSFLVKNVNLAYSQIGFSDYLLKVNSDSLKLKEIKEIKNDFDIKSNTTTVKLKNDHIESVTNRNYSINDDSNYVEKEVGSKAFEMLINFNNKLEKMHFKKENSEQIIGQTSMFNSFKMLLYGSIFGTICCLNKDLKSYYSKVKKEFQIRLELESLFKSQDQTYMFTHLFLTDQQLHLLK